MTDVTQVRLIENLLNVTQGALLDRFYVYTNTVPGLQLKTTVGQQITQCTFQESNR